MDTVRYVLALLFVCTLPPAVVYWYLAHPLARMWRRVPTFLTFTALTTVLAGGAALLFLFREPLLSVEYGTSWPRIALGALVYGVAMGFEVRVRRQLGFRVLAGVPELSGNDPGELLTDGVYGRVRHPRYGVVFLATLGMALITGYLAVYILVPVMAVGLYLIVVLEERELRERFGERWVRYRERVPMFIPRTGSGG